MFDLCPPSAHPRILPRFITSTLNIPQLMYNAMPVNRRVLWVWKNFQCQVRRGSKISITKPTNKHSLSLFPPSLPNGAIVENPPAKIYLKPASKLEVSDFFSLCSFEMEIFFYLPFCDEFGFSVRIFLTRLSMFDRKRDRNKMRGCCANCFYHFAAYECHLSSIIQPDDVERNDE